MKYRTLGKTGLRVSALAFGAGPVSTLMVGETSDHQREVISYAVDCGINWFDTAATYGQGQSEQNLGRVLRELSVVDRVHVASKVRLTVEDLRDIKSSVRRSVEASLGRLQLPRLALLQLHNSITSQRGDEPTSVEVRDVLGTSGIADAFDGLRAEGLVVHTGLTGIGNPASLAEVVHSRRFDTMQVPYHLLNASAGKAVGDGFPETDYGNIISACASEQMGVFVIRVLAGGALADNPPSPHTLKTPFFPLDLYERDRRRAIQLQDWLRIQPGLPRHLPQEAVRFALAHPDVHSAIIGLGEAQQIDEAISAIELCTPELNWSEADNCSSETDS